MAETLLSRLFSPGVWPAAALASALALLGAAHAFETFGHLLPCELCLAQRSADWATSGIALAGLLAAYLAKDRRVALLRLTCAGLALAFLAAAGLGAYHAGVEWKWWPGPAACTGGGVGRVSLSDLSAFAHGARYNVIRCDEAAWRMFGVSMAGYNCLISLALAAASFLSAHRPVEA